MNLKLYIFKSTSFKILGIILLTLIIDNLFIFSISSPPGWDQGYHLSNVFKMSNIISANGINFFNKADQLLDVSETYRGPLTYFLSALFLNIFNYSYEYAYLSNQIFNVICIFSIINLGKFFKNNSIGIWAAFIFSFSTLIVNQRTDYLIDLSLTAFSSLSLLFFTKWNFEKSNNIKYAVLSGISLGLIFLTKPTGIILFFLPFTIIFIKKLKIKENKFFEIIKIFFFFISFFLIIFPWFSKHWLTIITSTINAWNWGINYQDGYNSFSLESWLFYLKSLPKVFGVINFTVFLIIFIFEKISQRNLFKISFKKIKKINFWFFTYIFNCFLILSLMSTKDIRFVMPIYPLICIYLSIFLNQKTYKYFKHFTKKVILVLTVFLTLFFSNHELISHKINQSTIYKWPHFEIINEIKNSNPNLTTTLAVLPDTREINTFNLEAEAARQGENVAVRQIISNTNTYKDDLKYFDWFLLKSGNQGVMSNKSKDLLSEYLLDNNSFTYQREWELPDKSNLTLLKRKRINSSLSKTECVSNFTDLNIQQIENGINIHLKGKGKALHSSNLLIDFFGKDFKKFTNITLANGFFIKNLESESCYLLSQDIPINFPENISGNLFFKVRLLNKEGQVKEINTKENNFPIEKKFINKDYILMANRIKKVEDLGILLREGKFQTLFDLVGIINQSDPKQAYLNNAEKIYIQRFKENGRIENLYSILISQILQRKIQQAEKTIDSIIEFDFKNKNAYLTKSIISVYLLDKDQARFSVDKTKQMDNSLENEEITNIVEGLTYLLEMKFINAYKTFT